MGDWKYRFNTTTFEGFMRRFFQNSTLAGTGKKAYPGLDLHYFNKKIIAPEIAPNTNAEIVLSIQNSVGTYVGFKVIIVHKINGEITRQWFGFKDYLTAPETATGVLNYPHIIEHCSKDWYCHGAHPESIPKMRRAMHEYIDLYSIK